MNNTLHYINLHSRMHLPTTKIILPMNGANSKLLKSRTPASDPEVLLFHSKR